MESVGRLMKKVQIGVKYNKINYVFRETCFGIYEKNKQFYLTKKNNEISLIGGGKEPEESYFECLKREFLEESGCLVREATHLYTINCYWVTRDNINMQSLVHIFLVEIDDKIMLPLEKESELVIMDKNKVLEKLELPYQKKAMEMYLSEKW